MTKERGVWCSRCKATAPHREWKLVLGEGVAWKHVGGLRDGPNYICEPDDHGNTECGHILPVPEKKGTRL